MVKTMCSLCGKAGSAAPLDMGDAVFGSYVRAMRRFGLSRHSDPPGVCKECMPKYTAMQADYGRKKLVYGAAAVVFFFAYYNLTGSAAVALALSLFIGALSLLSYCPPLKK